MEAAVNSPRNKPDCLADEVINLRKSLEQKEQEIEQLLDYIQLLRQKRFGRSSEKTSPDQCRLFDEGELEQLLVELDEQVAKEDTTEKDTLPAKANAQKKKPVRRPLPAGLKRVEKIIDVSDEEKAAMGENWKLIGYVTSEQLAVIQRQHYVVVTKRAKYAPVNESITGAEQGIKIAALGFPSARII